MRSIAGGVIRDREDGESDPWSPISSIIDTAALALFALHCAISSGGC